MYHVKLVLHRAASRYTYDWELVHTSRQRLSERDRVQLDGQIAAYVRFLAEEKRELGTYSVEKWF